MQSMNVGGEAQRPSGCREGAVLIGAGLASASSLQFALSLALAATADSLQPAAGVTYLVIIAALAVTAAAGLLHPVRRALALQPMEALRRE